MPTPDQPKTETLEQSSFNNADLITLLEAFQGKELPEWGRLHSGQIVLSDKGEQRCFEFDSYTKAVDFGNSYRMLSKHEVVTTLPTLQIKDVLEGTNLAITGGHLRDLANELKEKLFGNK